MDIPGKMYLNASCEIEASSDGRVDHREFFERHHIDLNVFKK